MLSTKFVLATIVVIGVILHGSLFPYEFRVPAGPAGPITTLLCSWKTPPSSYGDLLANVLLYGPFGFLGALSIRVGSIIRVSVVILCGLLLSVLVELAQFYDTGRVTNMSDVYLNTAGAALGAIAAVFLESTTTIRRLRIDSSSYPINVMLLAAMLGYHLFPYVPTIDASKYWHSVREAILSPRLSADLLLHYTALWLTTCWLVSGIFGYRRSCILLPPFIAIVFLGKILIETLILSFPEVVGAGLALALWLAIGHRQWRATMATAAVLCGSIIVGRLEPFLFQPMARSFGWLPFRSFLDGSLVVNIMAFFEKFFLYGSLIWLGVNAGLPLWLATLIVALLLLITSISETYLPGRSAEITDTVMALIIGMIIAPIRKRAAH